MSKSKKHKRRIEKNHQKRYRAAFQSSKPKVYHRTPTAEESGQGMKLSPQLNSE
ncbi:predicted protein [Botrytis cinerea T4]|uniref:Uncharacterized protein n=1 Tax=Botryotinia fuckeliana (strain T4) TaxID=999810 RepID=G2XP89_BOTF4|nr:predicted protein [Botrytis cinerea T4]